MLESRVEALRVVVATCSEEREAVHNYTWWSNRLSEVRREYEVSPKRLLYIQTMRDLWRDRSAELLSEEAPE